MQGAIQFTAVTFAYRSGEPVLQDFTLDIAAGEMVGLVGTSGAGKSTLINLLLRLYDVNEGRITLDGIDLRDWDPASMRRQVGVVLQDPLLFAGTVAANISYAKPDATHAEVVQAARCAQAHDFVMGFPDGYETLVGEHGQRLSGGERQRIAIARAILHDPRILILDEATSALDLETEERIHAALSALMTGRTVIAIAHRLATLRRADRLVVLEVGPDRRDGNTPPAYGCRGPLPGHGRCAAATRGCPDTQSCLNGPGWSQATHQACRYGALPRSQDGAAVRKHPRSCRIGTGSRLQKPDRFDIPLGYQDFMSIMQGVLENPA